MKDVLNTEHFVTLSIEAARNGWIIKEKGKVAEIFSRWDSAVMYMKDRLTNCAKEQICRNTL